jgi:cell division protein FtsW (lipid II flippase)
MGRSQSFIPYLFAEISLMSALGWFINAYTPDSWQSVGVFFAILAAIIATGLGYFQINTRQTALITGGIILMLYLRYLGLREIFYPLLLAATLVSIELMLRKR